MIQQQQQASNLTNIPLPNLQHRQQYHFKRLPLKLKIKYLDKQNNSIQNSHQHPNGIVTQAHSRDTSISNLDATNQERMTLKQNQDIQVVLKNIKKIKRSQVQLTNDFNINSHQNIHQSESKGKNIVKVNQQPIDQDQPEIIQHKLNGSGKPINLQGSFKNRHSLNQSNKSNDLTDINPFSETLRKNNSLKKFQKLESTDQKIQSSLVQQSISSHNRLQQSEQNFDQLPTEIKQIKNQSVQNFIPKIKLQDIRINKNDVQSSASAVLNQINLETHRKIEARKVRYPQVNQMQNTDNQSNDFSQLSNQRSNSVKTFYQNESQLIDKDQEYFIKKTLQSISRPKSRASSRGSSIDMDSDQNSQRVRNHKIIFSTGQRQINLDQIVASSPKQFKLNSDLALVQSPDDCAAKLPQLKSTFNNFQSARVSPQRFNFENLTQTNDQQLQPLVQNRRSKIPQNEQDLQNNQDCEPKSFEKLELQKVSQSESNSQVQRKSKSSKKIKITKNNSFIRKVRDFEKQSEQQVKIIRIDRKNINRYTSSQEDQAQNFDKTNMQNFSFGLLQNQSLSGTLLQKSLKDQSELRNLIQNDKNQYQQVASKQYEFEDSRGRQNQQLVF
eukprot:403366910